MHGQPFSVCVCVCAWISGGQAQSGIEMLPLSHGCCASKARFWAQPLTAEAEMFARQVCEGSQGQD